MLSKLKDDAGRSLSELTDTNDRLAKKSFNLAMIGLAVNILSWVVAFITPEAIASWVGFAADISKKLSAYLLAFPFWSSFLFIFCMLRMRRYNNPTESIDDDALMSSYRDSEKSAYTRKLILLSAGGAALNTIFLVVSVIWFR